MDPIEPPTKNQSENKVPWRAWGALCTSDGNSPELSKGNLVLVAYDDPLKACYPHETQQDFNTIGARLKRCKVSPQHDKKAKWFMLCRRSAQQTRSPYWQCCQLRSNILFLDDLSCNVCIVSMKLSKFSFEILIGTYSTKTNNKQQQQWWLPSQKETT